MPRAHHELRRGEDIDRFDVVRISISQSMVSPCPEECSHRKYYCRPVVVDKPVCDPTTPYKLYPININNIFREVKMGEIDTYIHGGISVGKSIK